MKIEEILKKLKADQEVFKIPIVFAARTKICCYFRGWVVHSKAQLDYKMLVTH